MCKNLQHFQGFGFLSDFGNMSSVSGVSYTSSFYDKNFGPSSQPTENPSPPPQPQYLKKKGFNPPKIKNTEKFNRNTRHRKEELDEDSFTDSTSYSHSNLCNAAVCSLYLCLCQRQSQCHCGESRSDIVSITFTDWNVSGILFVLHRISRGTSMWR